MPITQPRSRLDAFQRLAVTTLVASLILVALGGAVRATDSGLACPDWPRCYGLWVPPRDLNIWLEHSHRLAAGVVGLLIAALLVWALARHRRRAVLLPVVAAAVLVNLQAALGALVVRRLLQAELVTAHLGMAMIVIACLVVLVTGYRSPQLPPADRPTRDLTLARASAVVAGLCLVQIMIGGHVTGIDAGLVYTDFPLMGGALFPEVTSEREAFHVAHRLLAVVLTAGIGYLCGLAVRTRATRRSAGTWTRAQGWLVRLPLWAGALVVLQIGLGVANLGNGASFVTVIPHLAVASWIWTILVFLTLLAYREAPAALPDPVEPAAREVAA